jgi:hypothetical protein
VREVAAPDGEAATEPVTQRRGATGSHGAGPIRRSWLAAEPAQWRCRAPRLWTRTGATGPTTSVRSVGLLAEEIDTSAGELLGNVPQAFSHIGLIIAASHLDRARADSGPAS